MIWSQIPRFRLPEEVIDEEVGYILNLGVTFKQRKIDSMKALMAEGYDAIFVGSGAPRGRDLDIPGRKEGAKNIHIGIDWLSSVSFGHTTKIGKRVIVLGGGNTAMDCCRTSRRIGGDDVKVIVRSGFDEMKASPWEKEDAAHEGIPILNFLVPKEFIIRGGKLGGMTFEKVKARVRRKRPPSAWSPPASPTSSSSATTCWSRSARRTRSPGSRRTPASSSTNGACRCSTRSPSSRRCRTSSSAATPPSARRTSSGRWRMATTPPCPSTSCSTRKISANVPPPGVSMMSQKMGIHEWSYDNEITDDLRYKVPWADIKATLKNVKMEVELGFDVATAWKEAQRCLNCDVQTVFTDKLCIECDACVDICPMDCITFTGNADEPDLQDQAERAGAEPHAGSVRFRPAENPARDGEGRRRLPALRPVRRALPDRRLGHAESR